MTENNFLVDLNDFSEGQLAARFDYELRNILENIKDLNTDHKVKREMTIKLTFQTNEARDTAPVSVKVSSKLAPRKNVDSLLVVDRDQNGKAVGAELKSGIKGQTYFDTDDSKLKEDTGNVIDYRNQKKGGTK